MDKVINGVCASNLFSEIPTIPFYPQNRFCCGKLNVLKTRNKKVITLDIGAFRAKEIILQCSADKSVYTCQDLKALTPYRCTFGYDVIVYVGYALFVHCRNEQEIIKKLAQRNISISDREINFLGKKFITYLAVAHRESRQQIRKAMASRGGYILHMDGTCEGDSPHLFSGVDGIAEIILDNVKLPSEKADLLIPFLRQIQEQYGDPISLVHDMGKGILLAIKAVFPGKPDFICHFHFLRDIGKDLLEDEYSQIRNRLKKFKIRSRLRQKANALEEKMITEDHKAVEALKTSLNKGEMEPSSLHQMPALATFTMIHWAFDTSRELNGYGFPFDRPHLLFYHRLKEVYSVIKQIIGSPLGDENKTYKPLYHLFISIQKLIDDPVLSKSVAEMEERVEVFENLRKALRIALSEGKNGLNDDGDDTDIKTIEEKVKEFREQITTNKYLSQKNAYKKVVQQIDSYWEKLFADPIPVDTPCGRVFIQPQRTNNTMERLFRDVKRRNRKRSGTVSLNKTLKAMLADTPLVKNLDNEEYLSIILDGCSTLEERFARIDSNIVVEELKKAEKISERLHPELNKIIREPELPQKLRALFA